MRPADPTDYRDDVRGIRWTVASSGAALGRTPGRSSMCAIYYERKATAAMRPGIRSVLFSILLLTAVLAAYGSALPARAASIITVSNCDALSLYEAITNSNNDDIITFACSGTISYANINDVLFVLNHNLTLDGTGQAVTIDVGGGISAFSVSSGTTLTVKHLTFTNGLGGSYSTCDGCTDEDFGGMITSDGTLNISDSTFSNSTSTNLTGAGVILLSSIGTVNIDHSIFDGNSATGSGGAILNLGGTLNVTTSTFSNNTTGGFGGAIASVGGTSQISGSTFNNNTANPYTSDASGTGGAVINAGGDMTVTNSTFSGNQAEAGGAIASVGATTIIDSTLVGNHANGWANGILTGTRNRDALASGGPTSITNTVLANGPTRGSDGGFALGGNCVTNGTLNDDGGNFSDDETCPGSHVSTSDLHLGALANNGGPTQTIAISTDSVAKDAVACISTINTDQRGYTRSTTGNICDAGAYEFGATNPIKSTTISAVSGSGTYGSTATLTATLKTGSTAVSGKTITFKLNGNSVGTATTNGSGVATLSNVSLSGISGGSHASAISVSFAGDSGYSSSTGSGTLAVNKADQTISFDLSTLPAKSLGDPTFDISSYASATSGLTVSFSSATTSTCTVSGSMVTLVAAGQCTINADQIGGTNYNAAPRVQQTLDVADTAPPVTTASAVNADSSAYTFDSWTHQAVTITLSATDVGTGVASTSYTVDGGSTKSYAGPFIVTGDGMHTISFWSTDNASNVETTQSVTVKIDTVAPTISGAPTTSANANGWYNQAVTIHWACDGTGSPVTCPNDQTISTEGTNQTVSGTAVDAAGNQASATSSPGVNIDLTAPTHVSGGFDRAADYNGWYTSPVTIAFSGTGDISGIASCTSTTYNGPDSAGALVPGTCTDNAGNTSAPVYRSLKYDTTAPANVHGTADRVPDANDWYNHSVGITFSGDDPTAGIASCTSTSYNGPDSASASVSGTCTDQAGNTSSTAPFNLQYDATAPTNITATFDRGPDSNGWYNHAVTVTFTGDDTTSGIASCTSTTYGGPDNASVAASGSCTDLAGNRSISANASFKYDATAPANVVGTPDRAPNGAGWYNAPVTFTFSGEDATSGIGSCAPVTYSGPDNGAASVSGGCTDVAGNTTTVPATLAYDATAPEITVTSDASTYTILDPVTLTCTATDALSGMASATCADRTAPAYTFNIGGNTVSATATDIAGNVGHGSVAFTVTASANDLSTLTAQFTSDPRVARQLQTMLNGVEFAERMNSASMKTSYINMYIMLVNQQRGRALTNQEADTLIRLAGEI
jgi:hypothetical protein